MTELAMNRPCRRCGEEFEYEYHLGRPRELCDTCGANAERLRRNMRARYRYTATNGAPPSSIEHGLNAYTNWGCRCDICREAKRVVNQRNFRRRQAVR